VLPLRSQYTLSPIEIARLRHRSNWIVSNRRHAGSPEPQDRLPDSFDREETLDESVQIDEGPDHPRLNTSISTTR
jgi:hypothetical protein